MKISVVIPTFNRAKFLKNTILSVKNQSIKVDEIIIIDDGSTDNTKEIVSSFNVTYVYQKNKGVSSARNLGISLCKYEWIAFLDSDDIWEHEKIEKQINVHKGDNTVLCSYTDELWIFNKKVIKQNKKQIKEMNSTFLENIALCKIGASSAMIHKSVFDDIGVFDETLLACEDYDLWLRILRKYDFRLINEKLIIKNAGHLGQLSFDTIGMDYYRIIALQKHLNSKYKDEVSFEIKIKKEILLKGSLKHKNNFFINFCNTI